MAALTRAAVTMTTISSRPAVFRPRHHAKSTRGTCSGSSSRGRVPLSSSRSSSVVTVRASGGGAGLDDMQITFVNVACKEGTEDDFKAASLNNASNSIEESDNCRFDCLQDLDDPSKFLLVEIYKTPEGPVEHKETPHYNEWRETVGDMMDTPRTADKYAPVYPWAGLWGTGAASRRRKAGAAAAAGDEGEDVGDKGEALADNFLSLQDEAADASDAAAAAAAEGGEDTKVITHVYCSVKPGMEEEFADCCVANAASSVLEPDNLRFDVLRNVDDPTKFLLQEVYATADGPVAHKKTPHYNCWREDVEDMMATPRVAKKYKAVFPVEPSAWKMTLSQE